MADDPQAEVDTLLQRLRSIPPQHASGRTVADYRRVLDLLAGAQGSPQWLEALAGLGSHLLESPEGDRAGNVAAARQAYRTLLEHVRAQEGSQAWVAAILGLANCIGVNPAASASDLVEATGLLDGLIAHLRRHGGPADLAMTLGNAAQLNARRSDGDVDAHTLRAIELQREAVRLLQDLPDPSVAALRGRAHHNLAALHLNRRTGVRSQNVDLAVRALLAALEDRDARQDPVGRVRTLRALAMAYPEWSGAESLAHAQALAQSAAQEADAIEQGDPRAALRRTGWSRFENQRSALSADLDALYQMQAPDRLPWLQAVIENHQQALRSLPRESLPLRWVEWTAGLARLLGRLPSLGVWDHVAATHALFEQALQALDGLDQPRLRREVLQRWGEFSHESGDFDAARRAYAEAAAIGASLLRDFIDPEHRLAELELTRADGLLAAYAGARSGHADEAVRLAEAQRTRSLADLLDAARALPVASPRQREHIAAAVTRIRRVDDAMRALERDDPDAAMARAQARLADFAGVDPSLLKVRRTDAGAGAPSPTAGERARLAGERAAATGELRELLDAVDLAGDTGIGALDAAGVGRIAARAGRAVVYLVATVHGGAAVAALDETRFEVLELESLTSDLTRALLYGAGASPGFLRAAASAQDHELRACLDGISAGLGAAVCSPLAAWLAALGVMRAVLVPLGSVGLLPLQVLAWGALELSLAPSARALDLAVSSLAQRHGADRLLVADPGRVDEAPLPLALTEVGGIAALAPPRAAVRILAAGEATLAAVVDGAPGAGYVHLACHGQFRPYEPLASRLLLAGSDELTLADVLAQRVDLSAARLVTLSACRSGNVEARHASDESLGFPAAFMLAGVPGVVASLWPVDDVTAMLFSVRLYELLRELEPARAVARTRAWMREVTAGDLKALIPGLRSTLQPQDGAGAAALEALWRDLEQRDPQERPYGAATECWGAFVLTGV